MPIPQETLSGIVEIMHRLYSEILGLEEQFGLQFGGGDFRPRIEYFHDAVRALVSGNPAAREPGGRLTVEMLAYDVRALRYLQSMPLATLHPGGGSPHHDVLKKRPKELNVEKPDRNAKIRLGELYQQYGVLFAALFKSEADQNFQERCDALNELVSQIERVSKLMESKAPPRDVRDAVHHIDHTELRDFLLAELDKKGKNDLKSTLKSASKQADSSIAKIDKAHLEYASSQLALFEDGRDVVKKLAASGMNLAGQFVASAIAAVSRGQRTR